MRQLKNPEHWNPAIEYVYARPLRLGPAEAPLMEVGSRVDVQDLTQRLGRRRVRAFFLQGSIIPAPVKAASAAKAERSASRYAAASSASVTDTPEEE